MPPLTREQLAARRGTQRPRERYRHRRAMFLVLVPLLVVIGVAIALGATSGGLPVLSSGAAVEGGETPRVTPALAAQRRPPDVAVAVVEGLQLRLPIDRARITAIAFHAVDNPSVVALEPSGGLDHHVAPRGSRSGSETAGVDIGAPAGSAVFAPVDGTVIQVSPYLVSGVTQGYELVIRPSATAGLLVRMTHLEIPAGGEPPTVGQPLRAGETQVGQVVDFVAAGQELSRYTADSGNHVYVEVRRGEAGMTP